MSSLEQQKKVFLEKMRLYRDISQNCLLHGTPVAEMEEVRVVDYAYFYPHPVFFIIHEGDEDLKDVHDVLTKKGYIVYARKVDAVDTILEEVIITNPVTSFLRPCSHPFIGGAANEGLIVRDGTYRDEIRRWTWTCDGVTYTYSKPIPEEWYGLSALHRDVIFLSTLYLCSILGFERHDTFPKNIIYQHDLHHLKKMPVGSIGDVLLIEGEDVKEIPACTVSLLDCKKFLLTSPLREGYSLKSLKSEYIRDLMQCMGFHGFTTKGRKPLNPSSLSATLFLAAKPKTGIAGDVPRIEGAVLQRLLVVKQESDSKSSNE